MLLIRECLLWVSFVPITLLVLYYVGFEHLGLPITFIAMLTFLESCQNLSRAQIMFWCQDLTNRNLTWTSALGDAELCCVRGQSEAGDPSAGHRWTFQEMDLTHRVWDFPLNPEAGSPAQKWKSRLGHRKAFLLSFLYIQLSSCSQTSALMSVPFFIQSWPPAASAVWSKSQQSWWWSEGGKWGAYGKRPGRGVCGSEEAEWIQKGPRENGSHSMWRLAAPPPPHF